MKEVNKTAQIESDLFDVFHRFPLDSLLHVWNNRHRLMRGKYSDGKNGCLMYLLSEPLDACWRIDSKSALMNYFVGCKAGADEHKKYQPAKWIVRWVDGDSVSRYDGADFSWDLVLHCLEQDITDRLTVVDKAIENGSRPPDSQRHRRSASKAA